MNAIIGIVAAVIVVVAAVTTQHNHSDLGARAYVGIRPETRVLYIVHLPARFAMKRDRDPPLNLQEAMSLPHFPIPNRQ